MIEETVFILEATYNPKFPYRITIKKGEEILLCLWVQDKWPTEGRHIFCIRQGGDEPIEPLEEIERVPVLSLSQYGKRLTIVLDRPINKRSDFLFIRKPYRNKEGEYEQIFWFTQKSIEEKRPSVRLYFPKEEGLDIIIDSREKHPYKFNGCNIQRQRLPVGDYALLIDNQIVSVVERKRFDDLLRMMTNMSELNMIISELKAYRFSAVVIEADYSDFLKPEKLKIVSASMGRKIIAELFAYHPEVQIVFARNRKLGNEWTRAYFEAVWAICKQPKSEVVSEVVDKYQQLTLDGGLDFRIRKFILEKLPENFSFEDVNNNFSEVDKRRIKRIINGLIGEGLVVRVERNMFSKKSKGEER